MTNISVLSLKLVKESTGRYDVKKKINSPEAAYEIFEKVFELSERTEEYLCMITLDTKNKVTGAFVVSQGSLNSSVVHPREIFKRAVMQNASSIIIGHNHPSGDSTPSQEDITITKRIHEAGKILGIDLLDHVIIGDRFVSMKEMGIL